MVQRLNDKYLADRSSVFVEVDMRSQIKISITFRDVGSLYGERACDERVWLLYLYESVSDWDVVTLRIPQTFKDANQKRHYADLALAGIDKMKLIHNIIMTTTYFLALIIVRTF